MRFKEYGVVLRLFHAEMSCWKHTADQGFNLIL